MGLIKAQIINRSRQQGDEKSFTSIDVLFNPTELGIDRNVSYAEHPIPGASLPVIQFVRGEGRTLSLELFLDRTDERRSIQGDLDKLRKLVQIDDELHAPPVCEFFWGDVSFIGVVTSLNEKHTLFDPKGHILRARVSISMREYQEAKKPDEKSPDRTRVRVLREGETLAHIAEEAYGDPRLWDVIAAENGIDQPRFVAPGTPLKVPAI